MHETEKKKIILIYNNKFQEKFDFLLCKIIEIKTILRASNKGAKFYTTARKGLFRSYLPYSNQFRQLLGKIINPMQLFVERIH